MTSLRNRKKWSALYRIMDFLLKVPGSLPEPDRRRARLLSILLLTLLLLITSAFLIAAITNPVASPFANPATPIAIAAVAFIAIAYSLNLSGRYVLAARFLVLIATVGAWGATLVNQSPTTDPFILAFVLESVLLSSILLRVRDTAVVAAFHFIALAILLPHLTNPIIFIVMTSGLLVVAAFVTQFDLAQINRQAQELVQSGRRFRALVENSSDAIALIDARGGLRYQSPPATRILGYPFTEAAQEDIFSRIHSQDQQHAKESFAAILRDPALNMTVQYRVQHKDGSWRWIETIGKNMLSDPTVAAIVANYRDITERKQAEEQIKRQIQHLNALHEIDLAIANSLDLNTTAGVLLEKTTAELGVDAAGIYLLNESTQTLQFLEGRGFRGQNTSEQMHLTEGFAGRVAAAQKSLYVTDIRNSALKFVRTALLDEDEFVSYVGVPLIAKGNVKGVLEVFHRTVLEPAPGWFEFLELLAGQAALALENAGLHHQLQAYATTLEGSVEKRTAELQTANEQLRQAHGKVSQALEKERELSELKSRFLATASHEFRTPLTTIYSSAELLQHYGDGWAAEKRLTHFERIQATVRRMMSLLDDVLLVSRADAGRLKFKSQPVAIASFFEEIVEEFQLGQGMQHQIVLELMNGENRAVDRINADERLLRIIVTNLLSNAIKYSAEGGQVKLAACLTGEQIHFSVTDKGIGIPPQDQALIFDAFHRATNVGATPGTGLGLNIVRHSVDLHGGTISFESTPGEGTTFHVTIPTSPATP